MPETIEDLFCALIIHRNKSSSHGATCKLHNSFNRLCDMIKSYQNIVVWYRTYFLGTKLTRSTTYKSVLLIFTVCPSKRSCQTDNEFSSLNRNSMLLNQQNQREKNHLAIFRQDLTTVLFYFDDKIHMTIFQVVSEDCYATTYTI